MLVVESPAMASLTLNGVSLPPASEACWRHDVTALLVDRNEMVVVPAFASGEAADAHGRVSLPITVGRVFLEILTPPHADQ